MNKVFLGTMVLLTSFSSFAQMDQEVTTTMPEAKMESGITKKWHAGIFSGISASNSDAVANSTSVGVETGYMFDEYLGAGMEVFSAPQKDYNDYQRTTGLIKGTVSVGGNIPVLNTAYIGAGVGPVFISNKVRWAGAPMVGFDVPLSKTTKEFVSLGLNARYVFTSNTDDVPDEFNSAMSLKYWF